MDYHGITRRWFLLGAGGAFGAAALAFEGVKVAGESGPEPDFAQATHGEASAMGE